MEKKLNTNEIPYQAKRLFIKLYCQRKGDKSNKTVQEAKKSWISLNMLEKKQFVKTSAKSNFLKYANSLSKTEVYVKGKPNKWPQTVEDLDKEVLSQNSQPLEETIFESNTEIRSQTLFRNEIATNLIDDKSQTKIESEDDCHEQQNMLISSGNETNIEVINETKTENDIPEANIGSPNYSIAPDEINDTTMNVLDTHSASNSNQGSHAMLEPAPPTVRGGRDLYEMLEHPGDKNWKEMTSKDRNYYNSAVRVLKREYIKNYTTFLESLSQQQLFDHYMKTLKS